MRLRLRSQAIVFFRFGVALSLSGANGFLDLQSAGCIKKRAGLRPQDAARSAKQNRRDSQQCPP